jgi:hypothetical protein
MGRASPEVTEATEGDGIGGESDAVNVRASGARNRRNGESIAQRSRRSQRGIGIGGESDAVNVRASGARARHEESIAEVTEATEGGSGLMGKAMR